VLAHGAVPTCVVFSLAAPNSSEWDTVPRGRQRAFDWAVPWASHYGPDLVLGESVSDQGLTLSRLGLQMNSCKWEDSIFRLFNFNLFTIFLPFP